LPDVASVYRRIRRAIDLIDAPVVGSSEIKGLGNNILVGILASPVDAARVGCRIGAVHLVKTGSEVHIVFVGLYSRLPAKNHALYNIQLLAIGRTWLDRLHSCKTGNPKNLLFGQNPVIDANIINQTVEEVFWGAVASLVMCADTCVVSSSSALQFSRRSC